MTMGTLGLLIAIASIGLVVGPKEKIKPSFRKAGVMLLIIGFGVIILNAI